MSDTINESLEDILQRRSNASREFLKLNSTDSTVKDRYPANMEIIERLSLYLSKHPYIRFGQALINLGIIDRYYDSDTGFYVSKTNLYGEEPVKTLTKILKNKNEWS